jgi:type VI secretion system protein ImpA
MPLSEDLLNPIPGTNPSGKNLRYVVYDKVKEARREDDEAPQGDWSHERKKADYPLVLRLCCDALANQTKDVQLAVWATEASLKLEGLAGLKRGLEFISKLIETFWDTIYPELEDGDAEVRAGALESLGGKFWEQLWYLPLTRDGLDWRRYQESRAVGYEADADSNEQRVQNREQAISDGKVTAEGFDASLSKTPKAFYEERLKEAASCLAALESLDELCATKFGYARPSFIGLRAALEDVHRVVSVLLRKKQEEEPGPRAEAQAKTIDEEPSSTDESQPAATRVPAHSVSGEPEDASDAIDRVVRAAHHLRREQSSNPMPYLLLRALRWGEIRRRGDSLDPSQLEAPSTEVRKQLRALAQNGEWQELLEANEAAMAMPCGRGWLDLQRYAVRACNELGDSYTPVSSAIISELKALLTDYAQLPKSSLNDETPAASVETQAWLSELTAPKGQAFDEGRPGSAKTESPVRSAEEILDAYELAKQAASSGHPHDAIAILEREAAQERSGRGRFQRKMQLAQICMASNFTAVAFPILEALAGEIDERNLEDWEDPDVVIHVLGLLYQCMGKLKCSAELKEKVYARICRLGPGQALELVR